MKKKINFKKIIKNIIVVIIFLAGLAICLYPTIADAYGKYVDSKLIVNYELNSSKMSNNIKNDILQKAIDYNNNLIDKNGGQTVTTIQHKEYTSDEEKELYDSMLKDSASTIMCTISIPKIAVTIPVYHWSDDAVLNKGIGHIHGSSLPVGCGVDPEDPNFSNIKGSHSLLIGHRGLPSLKLFSDLDKVEVDDVFYIKTLGNIYAYKVYDVEIVDPDDVEKIKIEPGRDLVTLITCTPYGVNTHRILVKGERIPYKGESIEADVMTKIATTIDPKTILGIGFIVFLLIIILIKKRPRKHKKKNIKGDDNVETKIISDGS